MGLLHANGCGFLPHTTAPRPVSLPESPLVNNRPFSAPAGIAPFSQFPNRQGTGAAEKEGGAGDAGVAGGHLGAVGSVVLWVPPSILVLEGLQLHQLSHLFHASLV